MWGKDVGNEGAACTAGNAILPILLSMLNPKIPLTWFIVTALHHQLSTSLWHALLAILNESTTSTLHR